MTTCSTCLRNLAATSKAQLNIRLKNMELSPKIRVAPCPSCGGTEWATTEKSIVKVSYLKNSWFKRLLKKGKFVLKR
jgi:hypothetical protein